MPSKDQIGTLAVIIMFTLIVGMTMGVTLAARYGDCQGALQ